MPHVTVKLYPGRSEQQKQKLAAEIARAVMEITNSADGSVSVGIEDVPPAEWTERVWKPEIAAKWESLYKKPGYKPG